MASKQIVVIILLAVVVSGFSVTAVSAQDSPCATSGDSTEDRIGCLDSDGDGWSDADAEFIENPETTTANSIITTICLDAMRTGLFEH